MKFNFDDSALVKVADEIARAREFVKIAVFQIHNDKIIEALEKAVSKKVKVEIITLPFDSINEDVREDVTHKLEGLKKKGGELYFCKWGIGDPARTTTAVGRWYSFHGKFIVTDRCAIAISANLTNAKELDAVLIFREKEKIKEYVAQFDRLLKLFVETKSRKAEIRGMIKKSGYKEWEGLFEAPSSIKEEEVRSHWIRDYPISVFNTDRELRDGLYLAPFDFRARKLYEQIIANASKFAYISTESFTDEDIAKSLIEARLKGTDIRVLTGGTSQDFQTRIKELYPEVVSSGVEVRIPKGDLHAKLIVTDKLLLVGSVNLNKMNLGKKTSNVLWRANTETITVCTDSEMIKRATEDYNKVFGTSTDVLEFLAEKEEKSARGIFAVFDREIKVKKDVRRMFAKLMIDNKVRSKKDLYTIAKYAFLIARNFGKRNVIEINDFIAAVILNYLTESMKTKSDITKRVTELVGDFEIEELLQFLSEKSLISRDRDFYKINLVRLIG